MAIRDAIEFARKQAELRAERKRFVKKEADISFDFIADSRKVFMRCSCGMSDEIWSLSGLMISIAKAEWRSRHAKCEGVGVEFHER